MENNQLNKLQIKAEVLTVMSKLQTISDRNKIDEILSLLELQEDKKSILEVLIKELIKSNEQKAVLICYLMMKLCEQKELETELWDILKNPSVNDLVKSLVLNLLKELGNKIDYEKFNEYFENPQDVIDADTQKLLKTAIINPEAQIDFLDFLKSLSDEDKDVLVSSLGDDYSSDALANIMVPLFLYTPDSALGHRAIEILGTTKSQLALHALLESREFVTDEETVNLIKKSVSQLKISGVREDNAVDFYKELLTGSRPYLSYTSYPDGHGNQALIFSREREDETLQLVVTVINDSWGILDCFGFNEISKEEFERIVSRFYNGDVRVYINSAVLKNMLDRAENLTRKSGGEISYEYLCWKGLLLDIQPEPVPLELILEMKLQKKPLEKGELEKIYNLEFLQRWFTDVDYNQEFKILIESIDASLLENNFEIDIEKTVKENSQNVFTNEDKKLLDKRILMCAYLKYLSGKNADAQMLYSLYLSEEEKTALTEQIIKKSIYEHYVSMKFKAKEDTRTTNIFTMKNKLKEKGLSLRQIESMISLIEDLWVEKA